jgi:hypothetical protein
MESNLVTTVEGGLPGLDPREKFRYLNVLIHSPGGRGKTTLISECCDDPRTSPILVLDCEGGSMLRFAKKDPSAYTIIPVDSIEELSTHFNYLATTPHPYKSVAVDSITSVQKIGLYEFVYGKQASKKVRSWTQMKTAEIQQWGFSLSQMILIMQEFQELKMHTFFTTLSQRIVDSISKKTWITVQLPGQQQAEVPGVPDIVGYIDVLKTKTGFERVLRVQPDGIVDCKDRTDALGEGIQLSPSGKNVTKMLDLIWKKYGIKE